MRDVTPQAKFLEVFRFIYKFLRHPIREIGNLPDWNWPLLLIVSVFISIFSGVLTGLIPSPNIYKIIGGLILSPIVCLVMNTISSLLFYYYFQVFERRTCSLRQIYTLNLFAGIPFYIFQTASDLIWIITPIAFSFTAMILVVGLVENFQMEKRRALRLIGIMLGMVVVVWAFNRIDISRLERNVNLAPNIPTSDQ